MRVSYRPNHLDQHPASRRQVLKETYLETRIERPAIQLVRAGTKGIHEIPANGSIALDLAREDGTHVREDPIEHRGDGDERTLEDVEVCDGVVGGGA